MRHGPKTRPYQLCARTGRPGVAVLAELGGQGVADAHATERGPSYVILSSVQKRPYGPRRAVAMMTGIALAVLILSGFVVPLVALLPAALLPLIPLVVEQPGSTVAVSAVDDREGVIITAHGRATDQVAAALDLYLAGLPPPQPEVTVGAGTGGGSWQAGDGAPSRAAPPTVAGGDAERSVHRSDENYT